MKAEEEKQNYKCFTLLLIFRAREFSSPFRLLRYAQTILARLLFVSRKIHLRVQNHAPQFRSVQASYLRNEHRVELLFPTPLSLSELASLPAVKFGQAISPIFTTLQEGTSTRVCCFVTQRLLFKSFHFCFVVTFGVMFF